MEIERVYYEHDADCSRVNYTETNEFGYRTCLDCAGVFWAVSDKGLAVTDKAFDEPKEM